MASHPRPSNRDGFEIAILCAVNVEVSAVEALFDEDWEAERSYGKAPGDPNSYKIGRISNRNIVLAYLPEMGKNSAVKTAIWLKTSFPNISLALLVGICGGAPSSGNGNDIVLGDVVISTGIVQYDLGRIYPDVFSPKDEKESNYSAPPSQVRSFLAKLQGSKTHRMLEDNTYKFLLYISQVQGVAFPGATEDKLYEASYRHKHHHKQDCDTCASCTSKEGAVCSTALKASCNILGCSDDQLMPRKKSKESSSNDKKLSKPTIHFGKVASGNFVMKSGLHRDTIASTEGVIAFEMEGAAIWEELPTVIVKSVCDYADSHKNKAWQKYAASVAAACSKAVINECRGSNEGRIWPQFQPAVEGLNDFTIPSRDLRSAVEAKERGKPSFWSHEMYRDSIGNSVDVHYATDISRSEDLASMFVNEPILGFGMQWLEPGTSIVPPDEKAIGLEEKYNICLIVLANEKSICIFHLAMHHGSSIENKIAPTLRTILKSRETLKAGVLIFPLKSERMRARFGLNIGGILELADLHRLLDHSNNSASKRDLNKHYIPLNDLVEEHFHLDLFRGRNMRLSNWGRAPLHEAQISFAASDAYAGYQLFRIMDAKRLKLRPVPPLPVPAEQQTPEQMREKEIYQPSFLRKRRAERESSTEPSSPHSSTPRRTKDGQQVEEESPLKRRRPNSRSADQGFLQPNIIDPNARFVWQDDQAVFNFGKYLGCSLQDIARRDRRYLAWVSNPQNDFSPHVSQIVRDALNGIFPSPPQTLPSRGRS